MNKKKKILLGIFLSFSLHCFSQIGVRTLAPNANSAMHISETTSLGIEYKGILLSRYTTSERTGFPSLSSADNGLIVYNTDSKSFNFYNSAQNNWVALQGKTTQQILVFYPNCSNAVVSPSFQNATAISSGSITLPINVSSSGVFNGFISTINGVTFSMSSTTLNNTTNSITISVSGTPNSGPSSTISLPIKDNGGVEICTILIPVT